MSAHNPRCFFGGLTLENETFSAAYEQENIESIFRETFSFHQFNVISKD